GLLVHGVVVFRPFAQVTRERDHLRGTLHLAQPAERLVHRDAHQPGRQPRIAAEARDAADGLEVGLLDGVLGFRVLAQDRARGAEQRLVVALGEETDRGFLAVAHAPRQLGVGHPGVQRGDACSLGHGYGLEWFAHWMSADFGAFPGQPEFRSPAAKPLMEMWIPLRTAASSEPSRWRFSSSTWRRFRGSR